MEKDNQTNTKLLETLNEIMKLAKENGEVTISVCIDQEARYRHVKSLDAFLALDAIANNQEIRSLLKHGDPSARFKTPEDALEWYRKQIWEIIDDYSIDLNSAFS